ncbi:response regulator [Tepidiphilus margaritifer]|uniref:response regulator n=1 Tax=Tepidiphilus margaritifer TaxID=203471 RepID=UPI00048D1BE2|nr:response regulator [Tepidiphilus margaritifer]
MTVNVLVVEDEPAILELIAVNLEQAGLHVLRAAATQTKVAAVVGDDRQVYRKMICGSCSLTPTLAHRRSDIR